MSGAFGTLLSHQVDVLVQQEMAGNIRVAVAQRARAEVQALINSGRASPVFRRFVDGVEGAPEEAVKIPGGVIYYRFSRLAEATAFALKECVTRSPHGALEPHYADSWFVFVNGLPWTDAIAAIPAGAEVGITNSRPYHRKIDVGGQATSVPPGIVEAVRQLVARQYPELYAERIFTTFPGAYILKGHAIRSGLTFDKRRRRFVRIHPPRKTGRSDARAGQVMTYPSLILHER